jgi:hypothetical protein
VLDRLALAPTTAPRSRPSSPSASRGPARRSAHYGSRRKLS